MKILEKNIKGNIGDLKLQIESDEDIWHLQYILEINDIIYSLTKRKQSISKDKIRPEKLEKITVYLGIKVKKMEFHNYSNRLRITGEIVNDIEKGLSHTINVELNSEILIKNKYWKKDQLERIEDAKNSSLEKKIIFVGIEEGDADIGLLKHYGISIQSHIYKSSGKKKINLREEFFQEVFLQLINLYNENSLVIIYGPGFTKEDFLKYIENKNKKIFSVCLLKDTIGIGGSGLLEILKKGYLEKIINNLRIEKETKILDKFLLELSKSEKAIYGYLDVIKNVEIGSVDYLLITDNFLREKRINNDDIDSILKKVEYYKGHVIIFSTRFDPGIKLKSLGGIAAILKY